LARARVVPFGIDKARMAAGRRHASLRAELAAACGVPSGAPIVAVVGRLDPEKRVGTLLRAFDRARRHRPLGLVVFGRGALERHHRRQAQRVPGAYFAGYVDEPRRMADLLASCDALLHGSAAETYGMAVAEALCAGVPVVVPDIGGAAALYQPACGERYHAGDAEDAAAALLRVLDRDPNALRRGCTAAASTIPSLEEHFARLFATYAELSSASDRGRVPLRAAS
jgi:alpha-1,6-mannosyltransferase